MGRVEVYFKQNQNDLPSGFACEAGTSLRAVLEKLGILYSPVQSKFILFH
jgi:hypothetical protein